MAAVRQETSLGDVRVRDIPGVVLDAGRLIARHWPALLSLALLGVALRGAVIWAAAPLSEQSAILPHLLLVLSPLGYLLPIIAMLHLFRDSLPSVAQVARMDGPEAQTEQRERRLVDVAVSVLVPFLAVYVSAGFIKDDYVRVMNRIAYESHQDALVSGLTGADTGPALMDRIDLFGFRTVLVIIAAAWLVRWALGRFERRTGFLVLAFIGALVEVYWTTQAARNIAQVEAQVRGWVEDRRAVQVVAGGYDAVVEQLGWLARPWNALSDWLLGIFGSLDAVVMIPLAWLTVGAVVLGHKLNPPRPRSEESDRWQRVPPRARSLISSVLDDLRERWSAFWGGLRLLAGAGLAPMLTFCLAFLLCLELPDLLRLVSRWIWGPTENQTWLAFNAIESGLALAVSMVITAALLAAAVDWLVRPQLAASAEPGPEPDPVR